MITTTSLKVGESLTIGLYFNNNYQLPTTCNLIVFIGGVCVGNLFTQEPEIERVGIYYTIRLSSQDTSKMRGYRDLIVVLDDPDGFGNKKFIVGAILFDRMADEFITTSENQGYNMLIGMTVDESIASGNVELIEAIKGEKGEDAVLPDGIVIDEDYVHTDNNYTNADKTLLSTALQSESDPIYTLDKDRLSNTSGVNTGDQDLSGLVGKINGHSLVSDTEIDKLAGYPELENLEFLHEKLTDKNSEAAFQHVDTTVTKNTLDEADKVALFDSVTGKVILTPKSNLGGSVAGLMLEADYTGEGTKPVNRATGDSLGREIHTTYALKQSGVTPPETARVILDDVTPTYTIVALTAENLIVENNATTGGEIIAPVLAADKALKISIVGNDTLLDGTSYADGVTIFAIYEASTETWTFTSILDPEVPDYSDMTVDAMIDNPSITPKTGYIRITGEVWILGTMVFLRTTDTPTPIGIYRCVGAGAGYSNLKLIAAGTALHAVRVKSGDVLYSQYDGANATSLIFLKAGEYTDDFINVPDGMVTVNLKKSQILGLSNATGAGLTNANTVTFALPTPVAGAFNQSVVYFEVGATLPTIVQPANTLIFGTLILNSDTKYKLQYDQIRMSATTWKRTLNFSRV